MAPPKIITVPMVATSRMKYGTRHLVAGDPFECRPEHVRVVETVYGAKKATPGDAPAPVVKPKPAAVAQTLQPDPTPAPAPEASKAGRIRRRAVAKPEPTPPAKIDPPAPPPANPDSPDLETLRGDYAAIADEQPDPTWSAEDLQQRIDAILGGASI